MKQLGIGARSLEEEMAMMSMQEEVKESHKVVMNIQAEGQDGIVQRPSVTLIIDTSKKPIVPKQNLQKPERSVQLMQEKGIGG